MGSRKARKINYELRIKNYEYTNKWVNEFTQISTNDYIIERFVSRSSMIIEMLFYNISRKDYFTQSREVAKHTPWRLSVLAREYFTQRAQNQLRITN